MCRAPRFMEVSTDNVSSTEGMTGLVRMIMMSDMGLVTDVQ